MPVSRACGGPLAVACERGSTGECSAHAKVRRVSAPNPIVPLASWFDGEDAPSKADLNSCIHCGLCLTACPTYRELKIEPDSPRGRIYLMRGLAEGRIAPSDPLVEHLDNCLDCRACETVCPAGVPYSRILEATRGQLNRRFLRGSPVRMLGEWVLRSVLPHRERVSFAANVLRLGQRGPVGAAVRAAASRRLLPRFAAQGLEMTPPIESSAERSLERVVPRLPHGARLERRESGLVFSPAKAAKLRVGLFTTCVMEALFPHIHRETVRLLVLAGAEVHVPRAQTCCGALQAHAGLRREARALAQRNVTTFARETLDAIVTHSAGCGAALRETGHLLHDDPASQTAAEFSALVRDVSEVLEQLGMPQGATTLASASGSPLRVGYHDPCHLAHAQRVRSAPRTLLRALPGVALVDLPNSDWCCGSAGIYNLTHPEMADAQLEHKLDSIASAEAKVVVASNPGCMLHMQRGANRRGGEVRVVHLVELLGRAYPAPAAAAAH
jgi:Fe-S oxidoreductase